MHGCSSGSGLLVNAEVDSMGGVVDGGVGIGLKTSPRRAAIERAQAELRQEYDVREERRRELEFLEKGGNPLDFKFGNAASVSVQSTSLTDQHPEQIVTSEAKGSFALAASPHGDSVESSGRPGVPTVCEPNSADNLLLLDGNNELLEGERSSIHPRRRNNIAPSEQSSQMDGSQNAKESEDSAIVRPYARRNRSRPIREGARGRDGKGMASETNNIKDQNIPSVSNPKSARSNGDMVSKIATSNNQLESDLDGVRALETTGGSLPEGKLDVKVPKILRDNQHDQPSQVNAQQNAIDMASGRPDPVGEMNQVVSAGFEHPPCATATKAENETRPGQPNGFSNIKLDRKSINEGQNSNAVLGTKGLDSESSCTQASLGVDVNNDNDMCTNTRNVLSNGNTMEQTSDLEETINLAGGEVIKEKNESRDIDEKNETNATERRNQALDVDSCSITNACDSVYQIHSGNGTIVKVEEDVNISRFEPQNEVKYPSNIEGVQQNEHIPSDTERKVEDMLGDNSNPSKENLCTGVLQESMDAFDCQIPVTALLGRDSSAAPEPQTCSGNHLKADKAHEDSILEEARIIEAKRKRIAELSVRTSYSENRRKSQWDFVLEEMAWLANDFAQERLWKINAAAQICHRVAFSSRLRFEQQNQCLEIKRVAHSLAKVVMQFWSSAEALLNSDDQTVVQKNCKYGLVGSRRIDGNEVSEDKIGESDMEMIKESGTQYPRKNPSVSVLGYAVRFLKYNSSLGPLQAEAPTTPDRISDVGIVEMSWEDHLTEESLLYSVPSGAMESYRKSIESHLLQFERTGSSMQEEVETSTYDAVAEYGYEENAYDEDEGETSTFCLPGAFEGSKSTKFAQKKRKHLMKSYTSRSFEVGADLHYGQCTTGTQQSMLMGKRPASLNVGSIPTKRMRTATRQRVLSPFGAGATGTIQAQVKTDASSGDTNSCQDDQSTLHGGSQIQKSVEVESAGDFEKQLPYDCAETSIKPKKKKKAKHLGSYDQGWQLDSAVLNEQRDHSKKRLDSLHFESNGNSGLYGQPNAKKPKIMKQSLDNTFDNITPMSGSIPSPVASQMSNMSNPNKFIKLIGGRDRGRKAKALKISAGQPGSGSPWSLFEDQALVVLVHDMGPNWELVSDVINSTLQFKCIFRKPKECKERHKFLMDRSAGDGADSAEDSGSSQSYPSTLPGIPKGSARQLFQRLQGPMEEDTIKAHFEKIILIGQKQHYRRIQNDNQDPKQVAAVHNSHVVALSQVCPNNLNGGFLTPLDLCDATTSPQDVLPLNYQGSHTSGLAISSQGAAATILPASGPNSALQGSSSMVLGSNLSSPSGPLTSGRDVRYNVPRSSLPVDEQQRMQQYNQMLSGRNIQQSSMSVPGALSGADRGVRMLPGGNGMGMMCGMSRGMPISRPGFQGMASSPMLNSGSMLSSSMVGMPSPVNMHSGAGPGQVNSMLRPREALHMIRPGHNPEHQRQMMVPELQMQVTQGNSQVIPPFNGLGSAFSNQTSPPVQPYAGHSQQQHQMSPQQSHALSSPHHPHIQGPNHATGPQHTAYAIRMAKERQLQHRYMQQQQQQQQQFAASNALMPHVPPQPQLPISSSLQNSSQIQPQTSSQSVSLSPVTPPSPVTPLSSQHQQKHLPQHGLSRNPGASGLTNQMGKQRQRQPQQQQFQQSGRHHPQQRQQAQAQQQAKLLKGIGRGNMLVHQNLSIDPSHLNGLSMPPGSQAPEKGEQIMHLMQGQGLYSGSGLNPVQPSKPQVPSQSSNHPQLQQKLLSGSVPPSSKQLQQMPSHSDNSTQGQSPLVPSGHTLSASHQAGPSAVVASNHHQQLQPQPQPHQKQVNQSQSSVQRMLQQNRQVNSELQNKSQTDISQANQQAVTSVSQVSSSTVMSQGCIDSANVVPVVSSAIAAQWKESEPTYDSNLPNSAAQVGSIGGLPVSSSAGSEPLPPISQGLGARQLSGSLPSHGLNVGSQWQPQLPLQQSPTAPPPSQQQYQSQEQQQEQQSPQHLPPPPQSQQQTQLLQAGQGSLYMRPTNSKLE